ncbi:inositol-3-phosphate synthase [Methylobacterium oryzihabitans]|uniref:Inositol-3-phosphate synthase n=1 Tax=Methylobacterium oryzihabitans TaxID=2499852 RepID=A0A3S2V7L9_9HYPH|nr:inositol-3-phosphate synthase [Methylobacterium oryzihabitans]RVU15827.1 inositol-3-phosphate synthase [Methylobacterium oryzihabitans]
MSIQTGRRLGVAFVGMGGAVATTAIAGIEMIKAGSNRLDGLPLAGKAVAGMTDYKDLVFGGWDLNGDDLGAAATGHGVLTRQDIENGAQVLNTMRPWPAVGSAKFCRNIDGQNRIVAKDHREAVTVIAADLKRFREESGVDDVVVVNLASTERWPDLDDPTLNSPDAFERGLDSSDEAISPAMLYAYAAIKNGIPYANFTPSVAADVPALVDIARQLNVPVAGKDGKTGQTMMKTVLAPAFKSRALHVDGWFSTNILGNRDGLALNDKDSLQSKINTKGTVLDSILGYPVEDHLVHIHYYRPRGDDKEAWDNIDITGFLGQKMQIKVNFLCKDSILAAPLVIEIARVLDLAKKRGDGGVQEQLSLFFKAPMVKNGHGPEHAFGAQERMLLDWLGVH